MGSVPFEVQFLGESLIENHIQQKIEFMMSWRGKRKTVSETVLGWGLKSVNYSVIHLLFFSLGYN